MKEDFNDLSGIENPMYEGNTERPLLTKRNGPFTKTKQDLYKTKLDKTDVTDKAEVTLDKSTDPHHVKVMDQLERNIH